MPTGACGINCDVCKLNLLGVCATCGPGTSREGAEKIKVQEKLFGQPCPVLACARANHLEYCTRDCSIFPCENFQRGPYPYSEGYLNMQQRRREEAEAASKASNNRSRVPKEHWEDLEKMEIEPLCGIAMAQFDPPGGIRLRFLETDLLVNMDERDIFKRVKNEWKPADHPLMELLVLVYLLRVTEAPFKHEMVGAKDLKEAHFFQGPHVLKIEPVLERFGRDLEGFRIAADRLGGRAIDHADAGFVFSPLPKILVYYFLWEGDEEFDPSLTILFDRSIEDHFPADFIWGIVNYVSDALVAFGTDLDEE